MKFLRIKIAANFLIVIYSILTLAMLIDYFGAGCDAVDQPHCRQLCSVCRRYLCEHSADNCQRGRLPACSFCDRFNKPRMRTL